MELKVEARNVELKKGWQDRIDNEKEKLLRHYPNLVLHLRVTIEATGHAESDFKVKLVAGVPGDTMVVTRSAENVRAALTESFDVLTLNLKEMQRKKRAGKKQAGESFQDSVGLIKKLLPEDSCGFIITPDDQEVYFHENALKNVEMKALKEGDSVFFGESVGDKGPQASWVRRVG